MSSDGISWHEGDESEFFTRTVYLYIDDHIKGFVAESGKLGWKVYQFSWVVKSPYLSLDDAKALLIRVCQESEEN